MVVTPALVGVPSAHAGVGVPVENFTVTSSGLDIYVTWDASEDAQGISWTSSTQPSTTRTATS